MGAAAASLSSAGVKAATRRRERVFVTSRAPTGPATPDMAARRVVMTPTCPYLRLAPRKSVSGVHLGMASRMSSGSCAAFAVAMAAGDEEVTAPFLNSISMTMEMPRPSAVGGG